MTFKIILRNLFHKPLGTILSIILLMFGVGIISMLLLMQKSITEKFHNDLEDIDLVVGAKGSPLQLVLSSVYHVDAPTGNIKYKEAKKLMRNPQVEQAIPLAFGDSYRGFKILGTDSNYIKKYKGVYAAGSLFAKPLEVVLGSYVAKTTGHVLGDKFSGTHGLDGRGHSHDEHEYIVTGILQPTNTVLDNLVITEVASVWKIHEEHNHGTSGAAHGEEGHVHGPDCNHGEAGDHKHEVAAEHDHADHQHATAGGHDHGDHQHAAGDAHDHHQSGTDINDEEKPDLTALLLKFRTPMALMTMPRAINETTNMQAASPVLEINRLFELMGIGITTMQAVALVIMLLSGLSVFIALFNRLKERKYELALARSMGSSRTKLFMLVLSEGLILAFLGFMLGIIISRIGLYFMGVYAAGKYHLTFSGDRLLPEELYLLLITLLVGVLAAIIPALKAFTLNISKTLAND